jgi:hypothetical protein
MNRAQYRAMMHDARAESRRRSASLPRPFGQCFVTRGFQVAGIFYTFRVERIVGARHSFSVTVKTSRLSERPRRALAADALQWARYYGNAARRDRQSRAMHIRAARACLVEASAAFSVFNRLP